MIFYEAPFHLSKYGTWVYDAKYNFIFEYDRSIPRERREVLTRIINGEIENDQVYDLAYDHFNGEVKDNGKTFIIIRGWGNLTGTGANNFPESKAIEIQDSLAQFIIKTLS